MHHLWYLSQDLASLAVFDDGVSEECTVQIVAALARSENDHLDKRLHQEESDISATKLSDFVTANTRETFVTLDCHRSFLGFTRTCGNRVMIIMRPKQEFWR
jgi:hypothetical protein